MFYFTIQKKTIEVINNSTDFPVNLLWHWCQSRLQQPALGVNVSTLWVRECVCVCVCVCVIIAKHDPGDMLAPQKHLAVTTELPQKLFWIFLPVVYVEGSFKNVSQ